MSFSRLGKTLFCLDSSPNDFHIPSIDFTNLSGCETINSPNCIILDIRGYDFILADESFAKALRSLETCVSVNNNLCGKLVSPLESPITFDERF